MKKNNKGFSLVELIVVILIMAILGVALTPQVMKWVNNSRISSDVTNYDSLVDAAQIAVVKNGALDSLADDKEYTIEIGDTTSIKNDDTPVTTSDEDKFVLALKEVLPGFASISKKDSSITDPYQIKVNKSGVVTRVTGRTPGTVSE